ncbi:uncharacterized protein LOC128174270 [Crassostrea angulata]|uniref:uncharacterized protein LOC128174270 n=1 Tax=Magallana angulata TaxID=2784310 RepID=UPI0022B19A39|nr:uncharacterized protein LOC128174270 [Crassostrea angulata]
MFTSATVWKKRLSPDAEAQRYCEAGLDKDGFEVKYISDYKGFGVFSVAEHAKGDFLLQYAGEKITKNEATERMKKSTENKFFFYCYKGQDLWTFCDGLGLTMFSTFYIPGRYMYMLTYSGEKEH